MARATLANLIAHVRSLTNAGTADYTNGTATFWDADQIELLLDRNRQDLWEAQMRAVPTRIAGGTAQWITYYAPTGGDFETTLDGTSIFSIEDGTGAIRGTATYTVDYTRGEVTFTTNQGGTALYLTARAYDVYAAAAALLESWATQVALDFDYSVDAQIYKRSQKSVALRELADLYRRRSWPIAIAMVRGDLK